MSKAFLFHFKVVRDRAALGGPCDVTFPVNVRSHPLPSHMPCEMSATPVASSDMPRPHWCHSSHTPRAGWSQKADDNRRISTCISYVTTPVTRGMRTGVCSADPVLRVIVASPGARPCLPLHGLEIALFATHHHQTSDRSRSPSPLSWELKPAAITTSKTTRFWTGKGLGGFREAFGRERERSAIEPVARCAPAVSPACPCAPEESDSLLCTQSGGLSPPPVLGAGARRTTSKR